MAYNCKYCDKKYKHRQSLHRHMTTNCAKITPKSAKNPPKPGKITPKSAKINNIICEYCNREFKRNDYLKKHIDLNRCKVKKEHDIEYDKMKLEIVELKNQVSELLNENCKIHPKTLQKINNQNNIQNQNNNNIQNNIQIKINGFSKENIETLFSDKEKVKILNHKFNSLFEIIKYTHFNNLYPENQNIKMTSLKNNIAYIYDDKLNKYIAVNRDNLIDDLIMHRMIDIDEFYTDVYDKLNDKTKDCIKRFVKEFYNDEEQFKYS